MNSYRLAAYWLPIPLGAAAYLSLRVGPWRVDRKDSLRRLRDEAGPVVDTGESVYEWMDRNTATQGGSRSGSVAGGTVIINAPRAAELRDADNATSQTVMTSPPHAPSPALPLSPDIEPEELS